MVFSEERIGLLLLSTMPQNVVNGQPANRDHAQRDKLPESPAPDDGEYQHNRAKEAHQYQQTEPVEPQKMSANKQRCFSPPFGLYVLSAQPVATIVADGCFVSFFRSATTAFHRIPRMTILRLHPTMFFHGLPSFYSPMVLSGQKSTRVHSVPRQKK